MRKSIWKRTLSLVLSLAMLLTLVPAFNVLPEAEAAEARIADTELEYITLPITIRDFAADGMLFEYNEVNTRREASAGSSVSYACVVNPSSWSYNSYKSIRVCTYANDGSTLWQSPTLYWHCVICDSTGKVVKVIANGESKTTAYPAAMKSGYYAVWAWNDPTNTDAYNAISVITESNKIDFTVTYSGSTLYIDRSGSNYNQGDTQAFGLLQTDANDYINNLGSDTVGQMSNTIYGSMLFRNGSWNSTSEPAAVQSDLYSATDRTTPYATQTIYGAYVRTNLVDKELDDEGKPVYTPETVAFLAGFMQQIMAVEWQNDNGTYNTYHVEGVKLFNEAGNYVGPNVPEAVYDLADVLRMSVNGAGGQLGTYAAAKSKFMSGMLQYANQATTWYEAAYYLLHYTWRDSYMDNLTGRAGADGYGMPISRYDKLHLIETTNDDGDPCYVFNARYDGTVYNYNQGEIFNIQLEDFEQATNSSGSLAYAYGNKLPVNRFDPLGLSGSGIDLGYGMSGDTYGNMTNQHPDWGEYYDTTNYNLTLEGNAQFVYRKDKNQYFTFTGDDDVYLYINGVRVLDIGGAHSISKVRVDLNEVADVCGMVDGGNYRFDFFFMERHGTASNFGIETNIELAKPSNQVTKTGYQNGVSTGYNGPVDPNKHVGYSFELQNDGTADIFNLTFDDPAIGVYFGWDRIQLYPEDYTAEQKQLYDISHLYMLKYASDGTISEYLRPGDVTEEILMNRLAAGLAPNEKIGIYGFKYKIPESEWIPIYSVDDEGNQIIIDYYFPNTVNTTATDSPEEVVPTLRAFDDWRVIKMRVVFEPFHVYDWVNKDISRNPATVCDWRTPAAAGLPYSHGVTVPKAKLIEYFKNNNFEVPETARIVLCNSAGKENAESLNQNATLNADGSITYKSTKPGLDTVFYKVKWDGNQLNEIVFNYDIYTYGTVNNIFVLDYGLAVELNTHQFGFYTNDTLTIEQNKRDMDASVEGLVDVNGNVITEKTGTYGKFTAAGAMNDDGNLSVTYTPTAIIDNVDTVLAKLRLQEVGTDFSIYTGVDMAQVVKTAPASVVYYEENFPGITYVSGDENQWVHYETVDSDNNPVAGEFQSPDQESNYGSDPNYGKDKEGNLAETPNTNEVIDTSGSVEESDKYVLDVGKLNTLEKTALVAVNKFLGKGGTDSNGGIYELEVKQTAEVMFFEFTGTGFEILSRTTDEQFAVITVQVQKYNSTTGKYEVVKHKPVITESIGGDMYQVPIISITGLKHDKYRVAVTAAGSTEKSTRVLYIDGIRIYGPLSREEGLEYYKPDEAQAEFIEIKQLVKDGKAAYFGVETEAGKPFLVSGISYAEDIDGDGLMRQIDNVDEYMNNGPNNELYLNSVGRLGNLVAFYLTPDETVPETARTIQIGAHRKVDSVSQAYGKVTMTYGSTQDDIVNGTNSEQISSGTEIYYTVDVKKLQKDENGYLLMIGTNASEHNNETLSLTNLKIAGYNVEAVESIVKQAYESEMLQEVPLIAELAAIYQELTDQPEEDTEPEEETEPEEDTAPTEETAEDADSASEIPAAEETETDAEEPKETEEATEPEETESEETEPEETEPEGTEPEETLDVIAE